MKYLYYNDNGACTLWDSKASCEEDVDMMDDLSQEKYDQWRARHVLNEFDDGGRYGYVPEEVSYLCKELGIEVDSI